MTRLISVIIPCYNHGVYINDAITSVIDNDVNDICEIIIINDGSTDSETKQILNELILDKVIVHNQNNLGLALARNKGIELSTCQYLLMLDSDNKIELAFLEEFFKLINNKVDFDLLHGDSIYFGECSGIFKSAPLDLLKIAQINYIDACAIIKKETIIELGLYDNKMPYMGWEDWDLWIRMALKGKKTIYIDKIFFQYRFHHNSMIRTIGHKENDIRLYFVSKYNNIMFHPGKINEFVANSILAHIERIGIKECLKIIFKKIKKKYSNF